MDSSYLSVSDRSCCILKLFSHVFCCPASFVLVTTLWTLWTWTNLSCSCLRRLCIVLSCCWRLGAVQSSSSCHLQDWAWQTAGSLETLSLHFPWMKSQPSPPG